MKKQLFFFKILLILIVGTILIFNQNSNYQENINSGENKKVGTTDIVDLTFPLWKKY